jgi:hypothetical protein
LTVWRELGLSCCGVLVTGEESGITWPWLHRIKKFVSLF